MKVKRLEIHGFKSFKDKTVIHFDDGVTGIVGPNGCGKSNIVDSFFWVMGEQSAKHLRGNASSDFIFSGSEKYSPGSLAEVTMVLSTGAKGKDLDDPAVVRDLPAHMRYEEIGITRRLYRNGESEYLINGQTCRLKDIHELFMDTGAGPKAYSIIEQGQISKIVASKPEDRRVLVEEAAGITKFKARKKESLRKIEATQNNLQRINDIVIEIERQLNSLEKQAAKARQYKTFKEELKEKELFVGRKRLYDLKSKMAELVKKIEDFSVSEISSRTRLDQIEVEIEELKLGAVESERITEDTMLNLQAAQKALSSLETKLELQKRSINEVHTASESLEEECQVLKDKIASAERQTIEFQKEADEHQAILDNSENILKEHQERLSVARKEADELGKNLEKEKQELMSGFTRQREISNQVHGHEAKVDSLSYRLSELSGRISDLDFNLQTDREKEVKLSEQLKTSREMESQSKGRFEVLSGKLSDLESEQKELRQKEASSRDERARSESRQKALQQLLESYEGFQTDAKELLKDQEFSKGLVGVFVDFLEAHPGYEYALESALRDFMESLLVESSDRARELLEKIKEDNRGRVSFWALDLLAEKSSGLNSSQVTAAGATLLSDVIRINHAMGEKMRPLLDRYVVVDDLDQGMELFRKNLSSNFMIVTRSGDVIDEFGRVSGGGAKSLAGGMMARKSELQQITERLVVVVAEHEAVVKRLSEVESELLTTREEFQIVSSQVKELEIEVRTLDRDCNNISQNVVRQTQDLEKLSNEKQAAETERAELWAKLDSIREELIQLESDAKNRQEHIEGKTSAFNQAMEKCAELQAGLIQLKVDFTSASEKCGFAKERIATLEKEQKASRARLEELQRIINKKLDEKDGLHEELETLTQTLEDQIQRVSDMEADLKVKKNGLEKLRYDQNALMTEHKNVLKLVEESSSGLNQSKLEQDKSNFEYQNLLSGLFERYGFDESAIQWDEAFHDLTEKEEEKIAAEVERLRDKIRRLGEVNIMAMEEYDEQKKRHEFLTTQKEDLIKSIADLESAIERINRTSEDRFRRAYEEINKRFTQIFPLVFGGGAARLQLTNPEDLAETGLEIFAEPPGKKMGSIQLMSGGEKALTAVALIFSIFLIKPSPFCVLDEVDAPLDDHNVGKFNMLLREMAERSQFIIITHNKRTMELNNKLYGVTMEEPGVSKMVSIEMRA